MYCNRRQCLLLIAAFIATSIKQIATAPLRVQLQSRSQSQSQSLPMQLNAQLNKDYMRALGAYRRLELRHVPREELRALTAIGVLNGARQAEEQMEAHLIDIIKDLLYNTDMQDAKHILPKIDEIERQLLRDKRALTILTSAMDLATSAKDVNEFKRELREILRAVQQNKQTARTSTAAAAAAADETETVVDLGERIATLRQHIQSQVTAMKTLVDDKIAQTLEELIDAANDNGLLSKASHKVLHKRNVLQENQQQQQQKQQQNIVDNFNAKEQPAEIRIIESILSEADFRKNLIDDRIEKRNDKDNTINTVDDADDEFALEFDSKNITEQNRTTATEIIINGNNSTADTALGIPAKQAEEENTSPEMPEANGDGGGGGGGGGGLVGLIGSLSGGEGGSDIGALIGALTGVISNLFGPGGLDIESLIGTSTSLISGLLAGNKNFGTVLGQYVGTAFDGLSGGGGAVNNGQFLGNFLGTVVASLSADPEEEGPPQPFLFAQTLLGTFLEAKNRKSSEEMSGERKGSAEIPARQKKYKKEGTTAAAGGGGSDSGSFVKQIVAHLVSNVVSLVVNASLGASTGASQGSSSLFAGSSGSSSGHGHTTAALHHAVG